MRSHQASFVSSIFPSWATPCREIPRLMMIFPQSISSSLNCRCRRSLPSPPPPPSTKQQFATVSNEERATRLCLFILSTSPNFLYPLLLATVYFPAVHRHEVNHLFSIIIICYSLPCNQYCTTCLWLNRSKRGCNRIEMYQRRLLNKQHLVACHSLNPLQHCTWALYCWMRSASRYMPLE